MTRGMARRDGYDVSLLLSRGVRKGGSSGEGLDLLDLSKQYLPFSRWVAEGLWQTVGRPLADRWVNQADWVYCPKELFIPVRNAQVAVTVHDLYRLESECPVASIAWVMKWRLTLERALRAASVVLTVSEFTKSRITKLLDIDADKIRAK